jgi:hypothetical protein
VLIGFSAFQDMEKLGVFKNSELEQLFFFFPLTCRDYRSLRMLAILEALCNQGTVSSNIVLIRAEATWHRSVTSQKSVPRQNAVPWKLALRITPGRNNSG